MTLSPYSPLGNRIQSGIKGSIDRNSLPSSKASLRSGVIDRVILKDDSINTTSLVTLYDVRLMPMGVMLRNVISSSCTGHYNGSEFISAPSEEDQNSEETPFVVGQPVLVGFIDDNPRNPVILGPLSCQSTLTAQSTSEYPKKFGIFQGVSWSIDKNGSVILDAPTGQTVKIKVNGTELITIKNGEVDISTGSHTAALGDVLTTFLGTTLKDWLDSHIHPSTGAPPLTTSPSLPSIETTILKVE